jgi:dimeric dUTPase (all-alpha-NTP-PPase superfamily)
MNLKPLFETQKLLRDRIGYDEPDRFNKLILALLVELGECANEWRGFKFWSKNQEPHTYEVQEYNLEFKHIESEDDEFRTEKVFTPKRTSNPLLEEYVDGLHFVLELGLEREKTTMTEPYDERWIIKKDSITEQFNYLFDVIGNFSRYPTVGNYAGILDLYMGLGQLLGFTWEQIEQAYMEKNKINHLRQESGY